MGKLTPVKSVRHGKVQASTLVEVLVASIIFLAVFIISLETSVRITAAEPVGSHKYLVVLDEMESIRKRYTSGEYKPGAYVEEYDWGKVIITIDTYGDYGGIRVLKLEADIVNAIRNLNSVYLFESGE